MRVVHLSYAYVADYNNPHEFLKRISFFTGIVSCMARNHEMVSIHCINYSGALKEQEVHYQFFKLKLLPRFIPFKIHWFIKAWNPDVIIVHGLLFPWQVLWLRFQLGKTIKIFVQHHAERPLRFPKEILQRLADKVIQGYFFCSPAMAEKWVATKQIQTLEKVHEVMEVSSHFYPMNKNIAREKVNLKGSPVYLWVGRLDTNKDPVTLLKSFKEFSSINSDAQLYVIFQSTELLSEVEKLSAQNPENITLVGKVKHDELLYWYNAADFVISTSHYEGSGVSVCEAMSCGCIPILSNIPSFNMMTDHGRVGLLFDAGNVSSLTKALLKSTTLQIPVEKNKVLEQFTEQLSFQAIADKIYSVVSR